MNSVRLVFSRKRSASGFDRLPQSRRNLFPMQVPSAATTEGRNSAMIEFNYVGCFALCALAIESARSVLAMRKQAQESLASFQSSGAQNNQELLHNQMEQAAPWTELLTPVDLSEPGKPQSTSQRKSKLDISFSTPWLYLSLLLLLWLLLL